MLEIILALAILAGSLAALGEVMRLAEQNASLSRDETQAQILAASIMDELLAGARAMMPVNQAPIDYEMAEPWHYSITVDPTDYIELVAVRVFVEQQMDQRLQPAKFELIRWMPNPDFVPATPAQPATSSSSSSGSSGASGGSGADGAGGGRQ